MLASITSTAKTQYRSRLKILKFTIEFISLPLNKKLTKSCNGFYAMFILCSPGRLS